MVQYNVEEIKKDINENKLTNKEIMEKNKVPQSTFFKIKKSLKPIENIIIDNKEESVKAESVKESESESESESVTESTKESIKEEEIKKEDTNSSETSFKNNSLDDSIISKKSIQSENKFKLQIKPMNLKYTEKLPKKEIEELSNKPEVKKSFFGKLNPIKPVSDDNEKEKNRKMILQIRNYINCFPEKLHTVVGKTECQKTHFIKNLFRSSHDELSVILEEIRCELNVCNQLDIFKNIIYLSVQGIEKSSKIIGFDIDGVYDDLQTDHSFNDTIKMLACEYSIQLSPQKQIIIKLLRAILLRYQMNKKLKSQQPENKIDIDSLKDKYSNL